MADPITTGGYDRILALDTQMIFEARPLSQIDWSAISPGPILLIVLPQVSAEIDARKRDGRLGKRSRDMNRLLEPSIEHGQPVSIVEQPVRVDIAYVPAKNIDWTDLGDLERDNSDDRIVAQAIHALVDQPSRIEVLSYDSRPRAAARRHGLNAIKPSESWMLDPEPSPADRRIAELEQRVKLLATSEPKLEVKVRSLHDLPLTRMEVTALPNEAVSPIVTAILNMNPRQSTRTFGYDILLNPNYDAEYDDYAEALQQSDVPNLHAGLGRLFSQYAFEVWLQNVGAVTAENVTVELRSGNARVHKAPYFVNVSGREPPSTDRSFPSITPIGERFRTDRANFYFEDASDQTAGIEYHCQDFRHGRSQLFTPALELTSSTGHEAHFDVRVTASNMRGEVVERCVVPVSVEQVKVGDLFRLDDMALRKAPPVWDLLSAIIKRDEDELVRFNNDGARADRPN